MKIDASVFESIVEGSALAIAVMHIPSQSCLFVNEAAAQLLGVSRQRPSELTLSLLNLSHRLLREANYQNELHVQKKSGEMLFARVRVQHCGAHLDERLPSLAIVSIDDLTEQQKTQAQLQQQIQKHQEQVRGAYQELLEQNQRMRDLDLAKDKFIALTTHELRTPLSAIVATAEVLALGLTETEEQKLNFIQTIDQQARHLMTLVDDILDFAKIRAGKLEFYIEHLLLNETIASLVDSYQQMAAQSEIKIITAGVAPHLMVWADSLRVREVIENVLNNAVKYNRRGGEIRISATLVGQLVTVTVEDTGPGIAPENWHKVFSEFETAETVSHHKGSGLGMPIAKRLMQSMGGDVLFTSQLGVGTRFYIEIPVERVLPAEMYRKRPDLSGDLAA